MIAVPIRYRRSQRALFVQKIQHAVPSFVVFNDGLEHLSHDPRLVDFLLGGFEVVASVLVMGSVIRGFLQLRRHTSKAHVGADFFGRRMGVEHHRIACRHHDAR